MDNQEYEYEKFLLDIKKGCYADLTCLCTIWLKVKKLQALMGTTYFDLAVTHALCGECPVPGPTPGPVPVPVPFPTPTPGPEPTPNPGPTPGPTPTPNIYICPPPGQPSTTTPGGQVGAPATPPATSGSGVPGATPPTFPDPTDVASGLGF